MTFLKKLEPLTLLLLRCGLALVFIYHGYPKLFGDKARFIESFQALARGSGWSPLKVWSDGMVSIHALQKAAVA